MATPLAPETLALLAQVSTATITSQLLKRGFRNLYLRNVRPLDAGTAHLVGPALTLRYIPYREDLATSAALGNPEHPQRKTIENFPAGQVLVMDCRGEADAGSLGGILANRLKVRGAAGVVSDGGVRDAREIAALGLPVYCAGPAAPANIARHHAVDANLPIACGGVPVFPGDIMVGDGDGVVVIPRHLADEVALDGNDQEQIELFVTKEIQAGRSLVGTYPPGEETRARYAAWKAGATSEG